MRLRTQVDTVTLQANGKWDVRFTILGGDVGSEYEVGTVGSSPVFSTENDAWEGGRRAMDALETTGKFPNMCERW